MFASRKPLFQFVCYLMALVTPLAPSAALVAQTPAGTEQSQYILPYSAAIVSARPRQLLTSEVAKAFPVEVLQAASIKELGFDPLKVERIVFSIIPPLAGPPSYAILVEFTERIDLNTLSPRLTRHTIPAEREGESYLQSQNPQEPSLIWVGDKTLLLAPEHSLNQLLSSSSNRPDAFAKQLAECENDDLALLVNLTGLRPLIQIGLAQARQEIPPEFHQFLELPNLLKQARFRASLSGKGPIELSFAAEDEESADRVEELIEQAMTVYRQQASMQAAQMLASEDPVDQAMGRYINRITPTWSEQLVPARNGERFTIFEVSADGTGQSQLTMVAISGVLVALLLPAVQAAREAARRTTSMNNVKQILLAILNYEAANGHFPAYANFDENGKPLLSWRVHVLPYLDQQALYEQFHLDEPWDSEHNRQLIPLMPQVYIDPSSPQYATEDGHTHYLVVKGDGLAFDGSEKGRSFANFRDGTSNSILVVQCTDTAAVPWTKPQDFEPKKQTPLTGLANGFHPGGFLAGFADGHVQFISDAVDSTVFWHMLTIAGGEVVPFN